MPACISGPREPATTWLCMHHSEAFAIGPRFVNQHLRAEHAPGVGLGWKLWTADGPFTTAISLTGNGGAQVPVPWIGLTLLDFVACRNTVAEYASQSALPTCVSLLFTLCTRLALIGDGEVVSHSGSA